MITEVSTSQKAVAITFDDGPNPIYTPQVLEIFAKAEGKATFFMIGE
jgi:peptidoglycan-N-acetylglucosamine deacetylase